jgi:hypothetical protein
METFKDSCTIVVRVIEPSGRKVKEVISEFPASTSLDSLLENGRSLRGEQTGAEVTFALV